MCRKVRWLSIAIAKSIVNFALAENHDKSCISASINNHNQKHSLEKKQIVNSQLTMWAPTNVISNIHLYNIIPYSDRCGWPHGDTHARASTICSIIYRRNIMVVWNATDFLSLTPIECRAPPVLIPSVCHTGLPRLSRGTRSTVEPPNVGSRYGKGRQRAGQPTTAPTATANVAANERTVAKTSSLVQAFSTVLRLVRWTTLSRSCVASCSGDSVCVGTGSGVERDSDLAAASETRKRILAGLKGLKLPDWPTVVIGIALSTRLGRGVVYERCRTP